MLQTVMQQNLLFYGIGILSFFGVISQIWLWMIYGRMTKDMENERAAKGKLIRQIRQRYGLLKRMGDGNVNTRAFIERSLYQYRHLGRTLHQWRRNGTVTLVFALFWRQQATIMRESYGWDWLCVRIIYGRWGSLRQ